MEIGKRYNDKNEIIMLKLGTMKRKWYNLSPIEPSNQ
jgi:hypothetical protein